MKKFFVCFILLSACAKPSESPLATTPDPVIYRDQNEIFFNKKNLKWTDSIGFPQKFRNADFNIEATCYIDGAFLSKVTRSSVDSKILLQNLFSKPRNPAAIVTCNMLLFLKSNGGLITYEMNAAVIRTGEYSQSIQICQKCF